MLFLKKLFSLKWRCIRRPISISMDGRVVQIISTVFNVSSD